MSNNHRRRTLEYDIADAPAIMAALRLAACTAMMCGHKTAKSTLDMYSKILKDTIPPGCLAFDEEIWSSIGEALLTAESYIVDIQSLRHSWDRSLETYEYGLDRPGDIRIVVGERQWTTRFSNVGRGPEGYTADGQTFQDILQFMDLLAPVNCERKIEL